MICLNDLFAINVFVNTLLPLMYLYRTAPTVPNIGRVHAAAETDMGLFKFPWMDLLDSNSWLTTLRYAMSLHQQLAVTPQSPGSRCDTQP